MPKGGPSGGLRVSWGSIGPPWPGIFGRQKRRPSRPTTALSAPQFLPAQNQPGRPPGQQIFLPSQNQPARPRLEPRLCRLRDHGGHSAGSGRQRERLRGLAGGDRSQAGFGTQRPAYPPGPAQRARLCRQLLQRASLRAALGAHPAAAFPANLFMRRSGESASGSIMAVPTKTSL